MADSAMYPGKVNSPITENSIAVTATSTTLTLVDGSALPAAPNIAVIGDDDDAETILYTGKSGNTLTGLTRGFQGTAKAWPAQTPVARRFTAYDYDTMRQAITTLTTTKSSMYQQLSLYPANSTDTKSPYGFYVIEGLRAEIPFTEIWIMVNAWYDYDTKRFKRYDINNFSFGWQWQGGGTYPGEESIGDFINQGMNLWKANGRKAYSDTDPAYALTGEDIGAYQEDGSWREFGIMLGWNNHFMLDSYGGMTIGGAGFEIDGSGTSPFKRTSLGKFTGGSEVASKPYTDYGFAYNGNMWNTQHGMWNKDEDQLAGFFYGLQSAVNFYDQDPETINPGSGRATMDDGKFVVKRLGGYIRPYVENWQDLFTIDTNGIMTLDHWQELETHDFSFTPAGASDVLLAFPTSSWTKDDMVLTKLTGIIGVSDVKLINKEQRWESGGLRVYLGNTNYVSVTATCIRVKKVKAVMHPLNGLTLNEHKVPMAIPVTATITGGVNATASYPTADHTASTTFVAAVKCVVDGVTKQFSNLAITFSGSTISCTLPETATSCTFVIQNY